MIVTAATQPVAVATAGTDVYVLGGASSRRGFKIKESTITEIIGPAGDGVHPLELPGDIATHALQCVRVRSRQPGLLDLTAVAAARKIGSCCPRMEGACA